MAKSLGVQSHFGCEESFLGRWKIVCHEYLSKGEDNSDFSSSIEGTEFELDDMNGVTWYMYNGVEVLPLLSADQYLLSLYRGCDQLRFCLPTSEQLPFKAILKHDQLNLEYKGKFMLHCQKVQEQALFDASDLYTLEAACEFESFSDLTIFSNYGRQFKVHKCILYAVFPAADWNAQPPPFAGLSSDALTTVFYFVYRGRLPSDIHAEVVDELLGYSSEKTELTLLKDHIQTYADVHAVRNQIEHALALIQARIENMAKMVNNSTVTSGSQLLASTHLAEPGKFLYTVKQVLKEVSLGMLELLHAVNLFVEQKKDLSKAERKTLFKVLYARGYQGIESAVNLAESLLRHLNALSDSQVQDLCQYLLPEVKAILTEMIFFATLCRDCMEKIVYSADQKDKKTKKKAGMKLRRLLKNTLRVKELLRMKEGLEKMVSFLVVLHQKSEQFGSLATAQQVDLLVKYASHIRNTEIPRLIKELWSIAQVDISDKASFRQFVSIVNMASSYARWFLEKARTHKSLIEPPVEKLEAIVHCTEFGESLRKLLLLPSAGLTADAAKPCDLPNIRDSSKARDPSKNLDSRPTSAPFLSQCIERLLESRTCYDLELVFVEKEVDGECHHSVADSLPTAPEICSSLFAHRAVVAARCTWFQRALHSGMREAVDRKFHIEDCSKDVFAIFLKFLYGSQFQSSMMTVEDLIELMTLADRMEVDALHKLSQTELLKHVNDDTALCLLSVADSACALMLKAAALEYVSTMSNVHGMDDFSRLSSSLQAEVNSACARQKTKSENLRRSTIQSQRSDEVCDSFLYEESVENSFRPQREAFRSRYVSEMDALNITRRNRGDGDAYLDDTHSDDSDSPDDDERRRSLSSSSSPPSSPGAPAFGDCVESLRSILGSDVPLDELVRLSLAADGDVGRAVNFHFEGGLNA